MSDGDKTSKQEITITIEDNFAPVITINSPLSSVEESSSHTISAKVEDKNGDELTLLWQQISGPAINMTGVDTNTLEVKFPEVESDTEATLQLSASDGVNSVSQTFTITVKNKVEPPPQPPKKTAESGGGVSSWFSLFLLLLISAWRRQQITY